MLHRYERSRKYTNPAASASPKPVANIASSTDVSTIRGTQTSTTLPTNTSATDSTTSSMPSVNRPASTVEITRCSRGNATLRTSAPLPTTAISDVVTETLKNVHGSRPHSNENAYDFRPLGSPGCGSADSTNENANV